MAKHTYIGAFTAVCTDTTYQDVQAERMLTTVIRCLQFMSGVCSATKPAAVAFGLKQGARITWLNGQVPTHNNQPAYFPGTVWANGDWIPFARFYGATAGEVMTLSVFGYLSDLVG
jgi:hypothetical protein